MEGLEKSKLRSFDESIEEFSDVVLEVDGEKFYQSKMYLSRQSNYFKKLFHGNFVEKNLEVIKLEKIDAKSFQSFLEVLYGESAICDANISEILQLADMYDAPTATRRCEEFLLEKSKWTLSEKLELAEAYNLIILKEDCTTKLNHEAKKEKEKEAKEDSEDKTPEALTSGRKKKRAPWFGCFRG